MKRLTFILAALVLIATTAWGDQWVDTNVEKLIEGAPGREEHPDASAVFLKVQKLIEIGEDGSYEARWNKLTKILTLMGREEYSNDSYIYNSDSERIELVKGVTVRSTGRTVEVDEDAVNDVTPAFLEGASIYANVLQKVISFPVAGRDATMELQLLEQRDPTPDGQVTGIEYLASADPIVQKEIRIDVPSGMELQTELVPGWVGFQGDIRERTNRWEVRDVPGVTLEEHTLTLAELYPKLIYSSYESWGDVAEFFAGQFYPHVETTGPVADHAAEVVAGLSDDEDKTRELFLIMELVNGQRLDNHYQTPPTKNIENVVELFIHKDMKFADVKKVVVSSAVTSATLLIIVAVVVLGVFALALLATVMSTVDSYSFLAASTFSRDIIWRLFKIPDKDITYFTRVGLAISAVLALMAALYFDSIVDIWYHFGSVGTPALLIPLFTAFNGRRRMPPNIAFLSVVISGGLSLVWLLSKYLGTSDDYWMSIQPIFPGLIVSILFFLLGSKKVENQH